MDYAPLFDELEGMPKGGTAAYVRTNDGTRVRVAFWEKGTRTALIFPGRTEYIERYGHVIAKLQAYGFAVVVIDWRGQGLSDRNEGRTDRGYVGSFGEYQQDIAAVLSLPEIAALPGTRHLFSHSMGGCIGLRALSEGLDVKTAVFVAPMWGVPHVSKYAPVLNIVDSIGKPLGWDTALVPGASGGFYALETAFEDNVLTGNPAQFARIGDQLHNHPELGLGGPTIHWAHEAAVEMEALQSVELPDIPVQIFVGSKETVVDPKTIDERFPDFPDARLNILKDGHHELWMEAEDIQQQVWSLTETFLAKSTKADVA